MADVVVFRNPLDGTRWRASGNNIALLTSWGWVPVADPNPEFYDPFPGYMTESEAAAAATAGTGTFGTALRAAYVPRDESTPSATVAVLGDSHANQALWALGGTVSGGITFFETRNWWEWANIMLGRRAVLIANAGVGGQTSTQIAARTADVTGLATKPGWCLVSAGANDIVTDVATATIKTNLAAIYDDLAAAGVRPVILTVPPSTNISTTARKAALAEITRWQKEYARRHPMVVLCDWRPYVTDPTTGAWVTGYSDDGIHAGAKGAAKLGQAVAAALTPLLPPVDGLVSDSDDPSNVLDNPLFTGTTGTIGGVTGTAATGWTVNGKSAGAVTGAASLVARSDGRQGNWQQVAVTSGNLQVFQQSTAVGVDWNVGDTVYAECEVECDAGYTGVDLLWLDLQFYPDGTNKRSSDFYKQSAYLPGVLPASGVMRTPAAVIPSGTTRLQAFLYLEGAAVSATIRVSRFAVRKGAVPTV